MGKIDDKLWRLNNLYRIINKAGDSVPFKLNAVQEDVYRCAHNRKLILKARQLGMSTYAVIDILDDALFHSNLGCGIVSYSLQHAQHIFRRIIGHALDTLPEKLKPLAGIISQSAHEITFTNGSYLRVDTTLRGGAYPCVLVSEFGKTCARSPIKAEEVITGTLQAVPAHGKVIIESTAEGNEGFFAEICQAAALRGNKDLSPLDYHFFFYPWFSDPSYTIASPVTVDHEQHVYFQKIQQDQGVVISEGQRRWYCHQASLLSDKIKQEFPSSPSEAFLSSSDAYYFAQCVETAYQSGRCLTTQIYDPLAPVFVAMDIGVNDLTVIIFFQVVHGERRIIDYYEDKGKGVDFYARFLMQEKHYLLHTIAFPHDAAHRDGIIVENTYEREFRKLFAGTVTRFIVLPRKDLNLGISHTKIAFDRCVFNIGRVKPLLDHLSKYRKKWSEQYGRYLDEPYHDIHSNYADAFRYAMQLATHVETVGNMSGALDKHKQAVEARRTMI